MANQKPLKRMKGSCSVGEAAKLLGINSKTVYRALEKGELKGEKVENVQKVSLGSIGSYAYRKQDKKRLFDVIDSVGKTGEV